MRKEGLASLEGYSTPEDDSPVYVGGVAGVLYDDFYAKLHAELAKRVGSRRLSHIEGVAQTAEALALAYGEEPLRARLAGLLHDWDKAYDDEGIRCRVAELGMQVDPYVHDRMARLLHGPTAACALARDYPGIIDPAVLQAVSRHTTAAVDMTTLDMIVYVADVIEPGRAYGDLAPLRAAAGKDPLEDLFFMAFEYTMESVLRRKKNLYPNTVDVWNCYADRYRDRAGLVEYVSLEKSDESCSDGGPAQGDLRFR